MKPLQEIYSEYKIMPTLKEHQLRVAAVAKLICDSVSLPVDTKGIVTTCLFHGMGNIIKFDLTYYPDFVQPEGLAYWQGVKDEYIEKYGSNEHLATQKIFDELGMSLVERGYLDAIGFSQVIKTVASDSLEKKICCYADQRVGPRGVLSIEERLIDGKKRYEGRKDKALFIKQTEEIGQALKELERQIFAVSSIKPEYVTDVAIQPIILELNM